LKLRAILTSSLGNVLEWYDFGLYAALSPVFAELFFPSENHTIAILKVFMVFSLGFLIRPIGGIFFGHFGDKIGRVKTLRATIFFMSLTTMLIAFLPTYQHIGFWAPLALIVLRLLQGFSLGGEFTGIIIYLTEIAPKKHRALTASFAGTAANIGILAANTTVLILHYLLTQAQMMTYGWRIAFFIGGLFGVAVFYFSFFFFL
jgi:MHS family proline/betaine transporter-like MFS transporter